MIIFVAVEMTLTCKLNWTVASFIILYKVHKSKEIKAVLITIPVIFKF